MNMRFILWGIFLVLSNAVSAQVVLKEIPSNSNEYVIDFKTKFNASAMIKKEKSQAFSFLRANQQKNIDQLSSILINTDLSIIRSLWVKQSVVISLSSQYMDRLQKIPFIKNIRLDKRFQVEALGTTNLAAPSTDVVQTNLYQVGVESVWANGYKGQGVVIAILDSGVDVKHASLKDSWRGGTNSWFDPTDTTSSTLEPVDFSGHGTAVAGIVLGSDDNNKSSFLGVAPNAQWIAAKIFANNNATSVSVIEEALQWVLDPDGDPTTADFPDIVQNSWGLASTEGICTNLNFLDSLTAINALGIDLVFAVGNSGTSTNAGVGTYLAPSFHGDVISVGAIDFFNNTVETILSSSSRGPNTCDISRVPALVAPGNVIVSSAASLGSTSAVRSTSENTGTSFSSPHVSGVLALLRSKYDATSHQVYRDAMFASAKDLGNSGDDDAYGRGLVKADAAMTLMDGNTTNTPKLSEIVFSTAEYRVNEETVDITVTLIRTGDISAPASASVISENGTALSGSDYVLLPSTSVGFLAGEAFKSITVSILSDSIAEGKEFFNLVLNGTKVKKISIIDNDTNTVTDPVIGGGSFNLSFLLLLSLFGFRRTVLS